MMRKKRRQSRALFCFLLDGVRSIVLFLWFLSFSIFPLWEPWLGGRCFSF